MDHARIKYRTSVTPDLSPHNHPKDPVTDGISATSARSDLHHTQTTGLPNAHTSNHVVQAVEALFFSKIEGENPANKNVCRNRLLQNQNLGFDQTLSAQKRRYDHVFIGVEKSFINYVVSTSAV